MGQNQKRLILTGYLPSYQPAVSWPLTQNRAPWLGFSTCFKNADRFLVTRLQMTLWEAFAVTARDKLEPMVIPPSSWKFPPEECVEILRRGHIDAVVIDWDLDPALLGAGCAACDHPRAVRWLSPDLFLDPDDRRLFGSKPLCRNCWHLPFETVIHKLDPPNIWDRLG